MGCVRGRVLRDFRCIGVAFCLNSYRFCDTCLIVKTLPFAECTVSEYTFLSQACSEQRKTRTSIDSICPTLFLCRYSKRQKVVTCISGGRPGLGILTVELQLELQEVYVCFARKKKVLPRRFFFALIGKDIQKDFTKIYEMLEFCLSFFFRFKYLETREPTWNGKTPCKVVLKDFFLKSRPLGKKKSRKDKLAKSKRVKIGVHSFAGSFASKALAV